MPVFEQKKLTDIDPDGFILQCSCHHHEHKIMFHYMEDIDEWSVLFNLERPKWYKRIWIGIKYIFGYGSKYGDYGEVLLRQEDVKYLVKKLSPKAQ